MGIKLRANPEFRIYRDGSPLAGGKVYTYTPGTVDLKDTYTDDTGATPHANPIILDSNGEAEIWWNGVYDLRIDDSADANTETFDNYGEGEDTVNYGNYNLVKDGGFEDDSNGDNLPDQWDTTAYPTGGSGAGVVVIDTSDQIEGANSLKFTSVGDGGGYTVSSFFEVREAGLVAAAWMMKSSTAGVRNLIEIIWYTNAQVQISVSSIFDDSTTNPTSWTQKTGSATAVSTARFAKLRMTGCHSSDATSGSTWYDDVKVISDSVVGDLTVINDLTVTGAFTSLGIDDNATETAITIDASKNAGIGVTPETWSTSYNVLQIGVGAAFYGSTTNYSRSYLSSNVYVNTSNEQTYIATDEASRYWQNAGTHIFDVAASGTADTEITWTTALTIDNSGGANFSDVQVDGVSINVGAAITNWVKGNTVYVHGDSAHATAFDVDAVIGVGWESVGPTGSGATNIWTALDGVVSNAKWVDLKFNNYIVDSTGANVTSTVYGRVTGSSTGVSAVTTVSIAEMEAAGSTATEARAVDTVRIPVDANNRFDLYVQKTNGTSFDLDAYLVGFGY